MPPSADAPREASIRYSGWRIVGVCFVTASFAWAFGFYGHTVYLAELQRLHGWPTSLISAATTFFYLFGALLVAFVSDAIRAVGPRRCLAAGALCLAVATLLLGRVTAPWHLFAVYALLAVGWAGTSLGAIATTLGLWFDRKRGMAISLALNGASSGGIVGVPLLVAAIGAYGFAQATLLAALLTLLLLVPVILLVVGPPPHRVMARGPAADAPSPAAIRARAARDPAFLTLAIAYALVLFAQVGFIVHLVSLLTPMIGRERAAIGVAILTAMAVVGRVGVSFVIDRLDQRMASAASFVSQAVALLILLTVPHETALYGACALFGVSVGNLITLPALIVQREFDPQSFGVLASLVTAVTQVTYAFGPSVVGVLRDLTGSYTAPLLLCMALEIGAAALILTRRGRAV